MLIPCIDLQAGQAVQLVHGRRRELAVADVFAPTRQIQKLQVAAHHRSRRRHEQRS